jgi:hypothetical protein
VLVKLRTFNLEAFAEMNFRFLDQLLQMHFAFDEGKFSQVIANEVEKIERHHHDLVGFFPKLILQDGKSVVPSAAGTTTSPSMMADRAFIRSASLAIFLNLVVQSFPRRMKTFTVSFAMCS